jgi:intracellular sulfur oxidation DsrE/DsrF family protein
MKFTNRMLGALLGCAVMLGTLPTASVAADKAKMVIQVSDNDVARWHLTLNNAKNLQKDLGAANVELEIVAFGPGVAMLKADAEVANRVSEAVESGVRVVACENTLRALKIDRADMNTKIAYVPAGVVEIMQRQHQGWAYLRP